MTNPPTKLAISGTSLMLVAVIHNRSPSNSPSTKPIIFVINSFFFEKFHKEWDTVQFCPTFPGGWCRKMVSFKAPVYICKRQPTPPGPQPSKRMQAAMKPEVETPRLQLMGLRVPWSSQGDSGMAIRWDGMGPPWNEHDILTVDWWKEDIREKLTHQLLVEVGSWNLPWFCFGGF